MPSPFPGMDPYIESNGLWDDFQQKLCGEIESALAAAVPDRYVVRLGERAYVVLISPDADVGLSLQNLIDKIYARSRYELEIDYTKPCRPPLESGGTERLAGRVRA